MIVDELKNMNVDFSLLKKFNEEKFPVRADSFEEYYRYRFIDNPFCQYPNDTIYSVIENGKYIAQMMTQPSPISFNEETIPAYWGQDYFVDSNYQGKGIGKKLSSLFLAKNYYISVGFTKTSSIVHKKGGCRCIGYLDYYEKWLSPLSKIRFLFHRLLQKKAKSPNTYSFPKKINDWKRIDNVADFQIPNKNWNKDTVETLRDRKYLQWRFFYLPNRYFCYQLDNDSQDGNQSYFVCKTYFYKGVNWLRIVDYRFNKQRPNDFAKIINTAERLAQDLNLFGILISSSMKISNDILEQHHYQNTAHKEVLTTYPFAHQPTEDNDEMHNHLFITFADNDSDTHTNQGKFNYGKNY